MNDRRRFLRICLILAALGIVSLGREMSRPSFEMIRAIDVVQLLASGALFGASMMALGVFFKSPRTR